MSETSANDIGYEAAMTELELILTELERGDVDVDALADRVARASVLVRFCRSRIEDTRMRVESVIAELDTAGEA